jgi:hypothetical protein
MSKFDKILNEISVGAVKDFVGSAASNIGKAASSVQRAVDVAKQQSTEGGSIGALFGGALDFFKKFKFKLKPVSNVIASKSVNEVVIADPEKGFFINGVYGKIVDHKNISNPIIKSFLDLYKKKTGGKGIDVQIINRTNQLNRFWVQLLKSSTQQPQQPQQQLTPVNKQNFDTWFVYKGPRAGYFEITEKNADPVYALKSNKDPRAMSAQGRKEQPSYAFKLIGPCEGLLQAGNNTLYPKWFLWKEYEYSLKKDEKENKKEDKEPEQINLGYTYYKK